jgi:hypothetical protein
MRSTLQKVAQCSEHRNDSNGESTDPSFRETRVLKDVHAEMQMHLSEALELAGMAHVELARVEERLRIANTLADWGVDRRPRVTNRQLFT